MSNLDFNYEMTISLNVLTHLGISLYSNIPAVLSEAVANSWDADATNVFIDIDYGNKRIFILDDGCGMTRGDINNKYLVVGYEKRKHSESITKRYKRKVMGRKGIGKLSLFSIANEIRIMSIKNKEKSGCILDANRIKEFIETNRDIEKYYPEAITEDEINVIERLSEKGLTNNSGTLIELRGIKKHFNKLTEDYIITKMARRFAIFSNEFNVKVINHQVILGDRQYFSKLENIWYFEKKGEEILSLCEQLKNKTKIDGFIEYNVFSRIKNKQIKVTDKIEGWIGTVKHSGDLKEQSETINKITLLVRGKVAQENILDSFPEGGLYTKYIIGELYADFLDQDDLDDIATSNRQEIINDDPRYESIIGWLSNTLKRIEGSWTDFRDKDGTNEAIKSPSIKNWFNSLRGDTKKKAEKLFGKINMLTVDNTSQKVELFKQSIIAFENLRYRENLELLESIDISKINEFTDVILNSDNLEAFLYHKIVKQRLDIINILKNHVDTASLEKIVQEHLYNHLWLLDPSWDRGTETPNMEKQVRSGFDKINAKLTPEEKNGRFDIKYKNSANKHIIIELKKSDRVISYVDVLNQLEKYKTTLEKILFENGIKEPVELVCLVGKPLKDWDDARRVEEDKKTLASKNIRIVFYQELIENAYRAYHEYLLKSKEVNELIKLTEEIEKELLSLENNRSSDKLENG